MDTSQISVLEIDRTAVDKNLFGSFIEHIENCIDGGIVGPNGVREDVKELCKELGPTTLRFPGGTVIGIYHWMDYVGPLQDRKKVKNIVWGGMMCREFGTAEYVNFCRDIGAEPVICVNMPTGSAQEAANWVEYCNGTEDTYYANLRRSHGYEEPFNVKYWCIGNESYAKPDLGKQSDINIYISDAWEFTKYMKMTDPDIELIYVGSSEDELWNQAVLDEFAPVCDYLSIHFYASSNSSVTSFEQLNDFEKGNSNQKSRLEKIEDLINKYNAADAPIDRWLRIPGRSHPIRIALDEWNIWNANPSDKSKYGFYQEYTWEDALWTAEFLLMMLRHSDTVGMANIAQLVNVIAPIMVENEKAYKQTTYYPFKMYRQCILEGKDAYDKNLVFVINRSDDVVEFENKYAFGELISMSSDSLKAISYLDKDVVTLTQEDIQKGRIELLGRSINIIRQKKSL